LADPQVELEKLNSATDNINRYEVELDVSGRVLIFPQLPQL